jgi:hypothetical protein
MMAEPNRNERISSSPITWSSSHYITFQLCGQRGRASRLPGKKSSGRICRGQSMPLKTICKSTHIAWIERGVSSTGWQKYYRARKHAERRQWEEKREFVLPVTS